MIIKIITCEDCEHFIKDNAPDDLWREPESYCHIDGRNVAEDDYCSWADEKEGEREGSNGTDR